MTLDETNVGYGGDGAFPVDPKSGELETLSTLREPKSIAPHRACSPLVAGLIGTAIALSNNSAHASGDLDPTFGSSGRVTLASGSRQNVVNSVIQQSDGSIVLAGWVDGLDFQFSTQLLLVRLKPDGTLDAGFGSSGVVSGIQPQESGAVVIQQDDDKLVVAGRNADTADIVLWRFAADGTPDTEFGTGGAVSLNIRGADYASGLVQQSSGKLVVAGTSDGDMMIARLGADGSLDTTFGAGGTVIVPFTRGAPDAGYALIEQPDGKLVMTGSRALSTPDRTGGTIAVIRTSAEGAFDTTFGGDGIQEFNLKFRSLEGSFVRASQLSAALQDDGKIVVAGTVGADGHIGGFLLRLKSDGALDPAFGTGGISLLGGRRIGVAIQPDGRIVTAGTQSDLLSGVDMVLRRYEPDGRTDTSFGVGGMSIADFLDMITFSSPHTMIRQADGKFVVAGAGSHSFGVGTSPLIVGRFGAADFAGLIGLTNGDIGPLEGNESIDLYVRRTGGSTGAVSVAFETIDGSAVAESDYVPQAGRLEWADRDNSYKTIRIELVDDGNDALEQFRLGLSDPIGGAVLSLRAVALSIGQMPELELDRFEQQIDEDHGTTSLFVTRSGEATGAVSVDFATSSDSALAGSDFTSTSGTLIWANGESASKEITVVITDDSTDESNESFTVSLSNPTGDISLGSISTTTMIILDDDEPASGNGNGNGNGDGGGDGGGGATSFAFLAILVFFNALAMRKGRRVEAAMANAMRDL